MELFLGVIGFYDGISPVLQTEMSANQLDCLDGDFVRSPEPDHR